MVCGPRSQAVLRSSRCGANRPPTAKCVRGVSAPSPWPPRATVGDCGVNCCDCGEQKHLPSASSKSSSFSPQHSSLVYIVEMVMFVDVLAFVVSAAALLPRAGAAACGTSVVQADVASTADAQDLASALDCTGAGVFNVTWTGSVVVSQLFTVSGGSTLTIMGDGETDEHDFTDQTAVIDAQGTDGIFIVSGASTLSLENLVLQGGNGSENGGAIRVEAGGGSVVNVGNCGFLDNHATGYGGERGGAEVSCALVCVEANLCR